VEIKSSGSAKELIIYADKPEGIVLDDCEKISRRIEPAIDEKDPIEGSYYLCVSSPGLDRQLKEPPDFKRYTGRKIDVKLYSPKNGEKEFTGLLKSFDDAGFIMETNGSETQFSYKEAASVKLHVDI
jgi:ribosome maturation factor RimP